MSDRGRLSDLGLYGLAALAFASLAFSQPRVAHSVAQLKDTSDVYPLPPTEQLPVYTLGYDFAAVDLLWAPTLVLQGLRLQQRRHFGCSCRDGLILGSPEHRVAVVRMLAASVVTRKIAE